MKKFIIATIVTAISGLVLAISPAVTQYSDQETLLRAGDSVAQGDAGDCKVKYFKYSDTSVAVSNKTIALCEIPANVRIIGGAVDIDDTDGVATMVYSIGLAAKDGGGYINKPTTTADSATLFVSSAVCSNGVNDTFADIAEGDTNAGYAGFDTPVYLILNNPAGAGTVWSANFVLTGWVKYID